MKGSFPWGAAGWSAAVVLITLLGFFLFPGHTYLQSDTQIYVPMLERLNDPALYSRDIVALRPHLAFTVYDETAVLLKRVTGADFQWILTGEQLLFRALAVVGLILIALRLGLSSTEAFFVAAVVSLGATIVGPAVLTVEYEPVPRGFSISLIVFALGLIAQDRYLAAGIAASFAFLYHPPTTLPFWALVFLLVIARRLRWSILAPLAVAGLTLALLARWQAPGIEATSMFRHLEPFQESIQHLRASYSFVSTWILNLWLDFAIQALIAAGAFWRLRTAIPNPLRDFLWGLPVLGIACVPLSWLLLEHEHWAFIPEWQPARAILFLSLMAALLCAVAAIKASTFVERLLWLIAVFLMPMQHAMVGRIIHFKPLAFAAGLAMVTATIYAFRKEAIVLAALIPFIAIPPSRVVENYPQADATDVHALANWARASTPPESLFLFPDSGTGLEPGIFRARSLRGLYVDWKSGGQVNYFPEFTGEWWNRWVETGSGRWAVTSSDLPDLAARGVDFVVSRKTMPGVTPLFSSTGHSVYATSSRDSR